MKRQFNWPDTLTIKLIVSVLVIEELQPDHSKDVDDNNQDEGKVTQGTQSVHNDGQQESHGRPGLSQFEHSQLEQWEIQLP